MAVPPQVELHRPLLEALAESKDPINIRGLLKIVNDAFELTEDDRNAKTPKGWPKLNTNVRWALSYLKKAKLVKTANRGLYEATDDGIDYLKNLTDPTKRIEFSDLHKIQEINRKKEEIPVEELSANLDGAPGSGTPSDRVAEIYSEAKDMLIRDLLERISDMKGGDFERLVLKVMQKTGYFDEIKHTGKSGDGGIDGILQWGILGINKAYVQAKRQEAKVSPGQIHQFSGSLEAHGAVIGLFITNSTFTQGAEEEAKKINLGGPKTIHLIDGNRLAGLMMEHEIGVVTVEEYKMQEMDDSFFHNQDFSDNA